MFKKRSVKKIFLYQFFTLGIYFIYWCVQSKDEINQKLGKKAVPNCWWFIVPFGGFWWAWQYANAVHELTKAKINLTNIFGFWILANFLSLGGFESFNYFPSHSSDKLNDKYFNINSGNDAALWIAIAVLIIVILLINSVVMGIFPAYMQNKFNELNIEPVNSAPPQPV